MKRELTHTVILVGLVSFVLAIDDILVTPVITEAKATTSLEPQLGQPYPMQCRAIRFRNQRYQWQLNRRTIDDPNLVSNNMTGELNILSMSAKFEGMYRCLVTNFFDFGGWAKAVSREFEIHIPRVVNKGLMLIKEFNVTKGDHLHIPCNKTRPQFYGFGTFKWYLQPDTNQENQEIIVTENKTRIYIDQTGDLHIINALRTDANTYICAVSLKHGIEFITTNKVTVISQSQPVVKEPVKPILRYKTGESSLTVLVNHNAHLECIFSGYFTANVYTLPTIAWYDPDGKSISNSERHRISLNGMQLTIQEVKMVDGGSYLCRASISKDFSVSTLILNVTSLPTWNEKLQTIVAIENEDVILNCSAGLVSGPPEWYYNDIRFGTKYDKMKYVFNSDKTQLKVKNVKKALDVMCFQCYVRNSVGEEFSEGCLNIFLPITFTQQPALTQTVQKGDVVDLTVVVTGDPTVKLNYLWRFRGVTYKLDKAPPHVIYNPATNKAYINTSRLTDAQMLEIQGVYTRSVYYRYQTKELAIEVVVLGAQTAQEKIAGGFEYWAIGLALGIIILAAVAIIIIFIIIQRKKQEGAYLVDKKEAAAGLNPEKELKDSGFLDLSRIDPEDYPDNLQQSKVSGALDIENCLPVGYYADDAESFSEYGEETTRFNEEGSFIGAYKESQKAVQQRRTSESFV